MTRADSPTPQEEIHRHVVPEIIAARYLSLTTVDASSRAALPSVDRLLRSSAAESLISRIGSGALPSGKIASAGLAVRPLRATRSGTALKNLSSAFRALPVPVIGRIEGGRLILDLRCLEDESAFAAQASSLQPHAGGAR